MRIILILFGLMSLLTLPADSTAAAFLRVQGTAIVDSSGQEVLLRGFGLGGWLVPEGYQVHIPGFGSPTDIRNKIEDMIGAEAAEEFYKVYISNYVAEEDIRLMTSRNPS
jgi:hypothetical protein